MSASLAQLISKQNKVVGEIKNENLSAEEEDEIFYISPGNLFLGVDLVKNKQVTPPFHLFIPKSFSSHLPSRRVPVVLRHGGKSWSMSYYGEAKMPRFEPSEWGKFVTENDVKLGDACVFELMGNSGSNLIFQVHLFRMDNVPLELMLPSPGNGNGEGNDDGDGMTLETPICID